MNPSTLNRSVTKTAFFLLTKDCGGTWQFSLDCSTAKLGAVKYGSKVSHTRHL
jgi:hypothetical protein